jgi:maltose/moltooligosaccharide transporter
MQSFMIGVGASVANALPLVLSRLGVSGSTASGIPLSVYYAFRIGAVVFLAAVLWTVFTTSEEPPADLEAWRRERVRSSGAGNLLREIGAAIAAMPKTMWQLAIVQFITWLGLFCMWLFFVPATAFHVFGAPDAQSPLYTQGMEWGGYVFAYYSITCFVVALALPKLATLTSRKIVHAIALACGAAGLFSVWFIHDPQLLIVSMIGVGIAWASILSMPYAILSTAVPPERMGVYMGVFNFFIVLPEILFATTFGPLIRSAFGADNPNAPLDVVMIGGACLLVAAAAVAIVDDVGARHPSAAEVIAGDEHELLLVQETAQPVPSSGRDA